MESLSKFGDLVEKYIRTPTPPLAVKMLKSEEDVPANAMRPNRDLGYRVVLCQAWNIARKNLIPVALLKEDIAVTPVCAPGAIVMGFVEAPQWWLDGYLAHDQYAETMEAAKTMESQLYRFEPHRYVGVTFSPLNLTNFEPDMVFVYCNSLQAMLLATASRYRDGLRLNVGISGRDVCSDIIPQTILTGKCQVVLPCGGDRAVGGGGDHELIFTIPAGKLDDIIMGLEALPKIAFSNMLCLPNIRGPLADRYKKLGEMVAEQL